MKISTKDIALFGLVGAIMYVQKVLMSFLPNVHFTAVIVVAFTVVYRAKALYPIYVYAFLEGLFGGFTAYWIPYLYIWTLLWGATMLLPKSLAEKKYGFIVYMIICGLHGLLFGTIGAPAYAIILGLGFRGMIDWIIAGLPYDLIHGLSNFCLGILVVPLIKLFRKLKCMI